jgi:hypothetical protein
MEGVTRQFMLIICARLALALHLYVPIVPCSRAPPTK